MGCPSPPSLQISKNCAPAGCTVEGHPQGQMGWVGAARATPVHTFALDPVAQPPDQDLHLRQAAGVVALVAWYYPCSQVLAVQSLS